MIPEIGQLALILALQLALVQGALPLLGAWRGKPAWMALARPAAWGQCLFVLVAFVCLAQAFLAKDFSVVNVAQHASSRLPAAYRLAATWGSHEGSMLLWVLLLAGWTVLVSAGRSGIDAAMTARTLAVMGLVSAGFIAFILFASNPFARIFPPPPEGNDLNPLLQDLGMILHPPLLYLGYVGFSLAFAGAVAALLSRRMDAAWLRWWRPWTLLAWVFLTAGVALGSWWAYNELGWGGWWFWDPTENASLMPWLLGTALLHVQAVAAKRGALRPWALFLAIATFAFALLGTFLVRSGVLSSVHAFALDPARGLFILALLGLAVGVPLLLFARRAGGMGGGGEFAALSRESLLLAGSVLLLVAAATVLLGTLYPLLLDALGLGKISVGAPYFNAVFVPLATPLLLLLGAAPLLSWGRLQAGAAARLGRLSAASLACGLAAAWSDGGLRLQVLLGVALAAWILLTTAANLRRHWRRDDGGPRLPLGRLGMSLAHAGVAVLVLGITVVANNESEISVSLRPGEHASLAGYEFAFAGVVDEPGPNFAAKVGSLQVSRGGQAVTELRPEKRFYFAARTTMTEAAIDSSWRRDLYAALGEPCDDGGAWSLRLFHKPLLAWLWAGAALMVLGGIIAGVDGARRR